MSVFWCKNYKELPSETVFIWTCVALDIKEMVIDQYIIYCIDSEYSETRVQLFKASLA